jgi:hydroxyethylthiazole kinase-like uncharacterized protein yjeF
MPKAPPSLTAALVRGLLPKRPRDSHKGLNGHVMILAGSRGMSGAAALVAHGALRIGAGLVTVGIVESERAVVTRQLPEALTLSLPENPDGALSHNALAILLTYLTKRKVNALAVGPGLSVTPSVAHVVKALLKEWRQPLVLDADGLNNIQAAEVGEHPGLIITPHVMELARLIGSDKETVEKDRVRAAEAVAKSHQLICVLKGHPTVISDGKTTRLNPTGNPAMATGGMGDVLTGAIGGLLAQKLKPWDAACAGVYLHGLAGDLAKVSDRGLLASDVAESLPKALAKIGIK